MGQEDPLEKGMATHSSILVQKIPWTEEHGGLQSMGLQRVRHDLATNTHRTGREIYKMSLECFIVPESKEVLNTHMHTHTHVCPHTHAHTHMHTHVHIHTKMEVCQRDTEII